MRRFLIVIVMVTVSLWLFVVSFASAAAFPSAKHFTIDGKGLGAYKEGGTVLAGAPDYDWWYGCSPTSAGMMMGYYDRTGYGGLYYNKLVPGGQAELSTFPIPNNWGYLANNAIASKGHVTDFYGGGYGALGDDLLPPHHTFDSLADFMGTSQDSVGNSNGSTTFYYFTNGSRLHDYDAKNGGFWNSDGMYGTTEYLTYAGYSAQLAYTQPTDNMGLAYGFSFADYKAEIDAGRVVMIHVEGHSMFGYGYNDDGAVYLNDTWSSGLHTMPWGGHYSGRELWGVTCFTPTGGAVPIPGTLILLGPGLIGLAAIRRRFKK